MTAVVEEQMVELDRLQFFAMGLILVIVLGIFIFLYLFYRASKTHNQDLIKLTRYATNVQATIDDSIPELLSKIIDDAFTDYQIMKLIPLNEGYITDEREKEIRDGLVEIVSNRISPMAVDKLSLFYNTANLSNILADKIYIKVMDYSINHNSVIMDQSEPGSSVSA